MQENEGSRQSAEQKENSYHDDQQRDPSCHLITDGNVSSFSFLFLQLGNGHRESTENTWQANAHAIQTGKKDVCQQICLIVNCKETTRITAGH